MLSTLTNQTIVNTLTWALLEFQVSHKFRSLVSTPPPSTPFPSASPRPEVQIFNINRLRFSAKYTYIQSLH